MTSVVSTPARTTSAARPRGAALRRALLSPALVASGAAAVLLLLASVDPEQPGHYPGCPFLLLTGHWCPGCGSLRALHALTHGDLGTAVDRNVLTVAAVPLLGWLWLRWTVRRATGAPRPAPAHPALVWGLLVVVLAFWLLRNLPMGAVLAP